tara:strand:- start:434 stop:676 length:243 start_codon:yes stop_codon:yes gene_type:complete
VTRLSKAQLLDVAERAIATAVQAALAMILSTGITNLDATTGKTILLSAIAAGLSVVKGVAASMSGGTASMHGGTASAVLR